VTDRDVADTWTTVARPYVIAGRQFASHAARRTVPARALANLSPSFVKAFSISAPLLIIPLALLIAPTRDIDCSSSILGTNIEYAEIAKLPYVFFKPPKRRRGLTDHHLMRAGTRLARAPDENVHS
jgi:hypothetical protein